MSIIKVHKNIQFNSLKVYKSVLKIIANKDFKTSIHLGHIP